MFCEVVCVGYGGWKLVALRVIAISVVSSFLQISNGRH